VCLDPLGFHVAGALKMMKCAAITLFFVVTHGSAPALPQTYGFTATFQGNRQPQNHTVYMDKLNQRQIIYGISGNGTIQLNRPKDQGCTYNVYGAGGSAVGCSDWAAPQPIKDPIDTTVLQDMGSETIDGVVCDKFGILTGIPRTAWFKKGTNQLFKTYDALEDRAGNSPRRYSNWQTTVPADAFDIQSQWKCAGSDQCKAN
jgi:hypothetical protein